MTKQSSELKSAPMAHNIYYLCSIIYALNKNAPLARFYLIQRRKTFVTTNYTTCRCPIAHV